MQETAFEAEGDAYHLRNPHHTIDALDNYLSTLQLGTVLDIGTQQGARLSLLSGDRFGIDASPLAIESGKTLYPDLHLQQGFTHALPYADASFDTIIISFVLHWVGRNVLLKTISEIDRVLNPGGTLIISDFNLDIPIIVPYHHKEGLFTYKQDYSKLFKESGLYTEIDRRPARSDYGIIITLKKQ